MQKTISTKSMTILKDAALKLVMLIVTVCILYPFLYCIAYSLSDSASVMTKNITIFPVGFTIRNYQEVLKQQHIFNSFLISVARTVCGIVWTLIITGLAAYAITKTDLPGRKWISLLLIIPMYVTGGLIPTYVLMYKLNLANTFWIYFVPHGFWAFNMLLMRTYFETIPASIEESAKLDGASDLYILVKLIIPLSMPIIAVIAMYSGVWQWNAWFDAMLYINTAALRPLQAILQEMIMKSSTSALQLVQSGGKGMDGQASPEAMRMATLVFTTAPIVCIYPFFQKHFVQGIMIGAVKG